jgi:integrase
MAPRSLPPGITVRHKRQCPARTGARCSCSPAYQAQVYDRRVGKRVTRTFATLAAARNWRQDAAGSIRRGELSVGAGVSIAAASALWLEYAGSGAIRNRSGDVYKPSEIRSYYQLLRARVLPRFGGLDVAALTRADLQRFVTDMLRDGLGPSTVRNTLMPVRALYRDIDQLAGFASTNPTIGLRLPAVRGRRDRVASPAEASQLLAALEQRDQALWATALYAGLRRGELRGLIWSDVDLDRRLIHVSRAWDQNAGFVTPKSQAGTRTLPIADQLLVRLAAHHRQSERAESALVFGRTVVLPFDPSTVVERAQKAWQRHGLQTIGLHECRHTYASLMIAAGVNAKALSVFMGHASITITLDRYGHLFPGSEDEAAALLNRYLAREQTPLAVVHTLP